MSKPYHYKRKRAISDSDDTNQTYSPIFNGIRTSDSDHKLLPVRTIDPDTRRLQLLSRCVHCYL